MPSPCPRLALARLSPAMFLLGLWIGGASGVRAESILKKLAKGMGKVLVTALSLSGKSRASALAGDRYRPLGAIYPWAEHADPNRNRTVFQVLSDVHKLLLRLPSGEVVRVVNPGDARRSKTLALELPPGDYAWVGFEEVRGYSREVRRGKQRYEVAVTKIWSEPHAFELNFCVGPEPRQLGGTLEVWIDQIRGAGLGDVEQSGSWVLPEGSATAEVHWYRDRTLQLPTLGHVPPLVEVAEVKTQGWVDREAESQGFPNFPELEKYGRYLERMRREEVPAAWPPFRFGPPGEDFRLALYESWKSWVQRQPSSRGLRKAEWLVQEGLSVGQAHEMAFRAKLRLEALRSRRQERIQAKEAAEKAVEEKKMRDAERRLEARSWGRRTQGLKAEPQGGPSSPNPAAAILEKLQGGTP